MTRPAAVAPLYVYNATLVTVHDGDTITVNVDLGFRIWRHTVHARIAGISALELSMPGGHEAAAHLADLLPAGSPVVVRSIKVGHDPADVMSFDRYVLAVILPDGRDLAGLLVADGWAAPWDGNTRPVPYPPWPCAQRGGM